MSEGQVYLAYTGGEGAKTQVGQAFDRHLEGGFDAGRLEKEGCHQSAFGIGFEQGIEIVAAGPLVLGKLGEKAVQKCAGGAPGVDPFVGEGGGEGFTQGLEVEKEQQEVVFGAVGVVGGGGRGT